MLSILKHKVLGKQLSGASAFEYAYVCYVYLCMCVCLCVCMLSSTGEVFAGNRTYMDIWGLNGS